MKKTAFYIISAICTQLMVCFDGLLLPHLRFVLKVNPSRPLFFLLCIFPYLVIGISLALTTILTPQGQSGKKVVSYLVPLSFIIFNSLFLLLYFLGTIPLTSSSMILPLLLVGYGIGGLIFAYFPSKLHL